MKSTPQNDGKTTVAVDRFWSVLILLAIVVGLLFAQSFLPGVVHFSNDGPLGASVAEQYTMPDAYTGIWQTTNWVGGYVGSSTPNITNLLLWMLGPVAFAKFFAPVSILFLGLSAWLAFRQLRLSSAAAIVAALATALNGGFFSYACWGLGSVTLAIASFFLAVAAWGGDPEKRSWMRVVLAGFAIGMGIMEGVDTGAILSVMFAAFVMYRAWVENPGHPSKLVGGAVRVAIIAVAAAILSAHAVIGLISTQIQGVVGMGQDEETKAARWTEATMWSLPKVETVRLFIPGVFGYRMDTPNGGNYWGGVGRHPAWDEFLAQTNPNPNEAPQALLRHSGSGFYCGVFVCLLAVWASLRSITKSGKLFSDDERKMVWFWTAVALGTLLLAWGRHAPFYKIAYSLPYFSTIRNPIKFLHPLNISILMLFAYGVQGLWRSWGEQPDAGKGISVQFKGWWQKSAGFERYWVIGSFVFVALSLFVTMLYGSSRSEMVKYLQLVGFADRDFAELMVGFGIKELLWCVLFLVSGIAVIALLMCGALKQAHGKVALGVLLLVTGLDLFRSNLPWINHFNYRERYADAPLYDFLKEKSWEHRAQLLPAVALQQQFGSLQNRIQPQQLQQLIGAFGQFQQAYGGEWLQHQFQYFDIQSRDIVQEPRVAIDNNTYRLAFPPGDLFAQLRLAQLTNSKYFFGLGGGLVGLLNRIKGTAPGEFREVMPVGVGVEASGKYPRPVPDTNSPFALIEYTGVLPRAGLYSNWQVNTNDAVALQTIVSRQFDPAAQVVVGTEINGPAANPVVDAGTVTITDYHPKLVQMDADVKTPAVLLFNDKYDPNWKVWIDGAEGTVLKCNFLMRGVQVEAGQHKIVWRFQPPNNGLAVSIIAIFFGLGMCGYLAVSHRGKTSSASNKKSAE